MQNSYHAHIRKDVFDLIPVGTRNLLDVGGGTGATAAAIKNVGLASRVGVIEIGSDIDHHPELDFFCQGDLEDQDFLTGALEQHGLFDTILCLDVLEHLVDPWQVVAQLQLWLEPGGVLVASVPNMRYYQASFPLFFQGRWELESAGIRDRTHLRWFVKDTAIELMTSSGLQLDCVLGRSGGGRKGELARRFAPGRLEEFATLQYLIRVRKPGEVQR